jgi:hypothetical protein
MITHPPVTRSAKARQGTDPRIIPVIHIKPRNLRVSLDESTSLAVLLQVSDTLRSIKETETRRERKSIREDTKRDG